jgi:outer membrane receptor protein involved in Fe transport
VNTLCIGVMLLVMAPDPGPAQPTKAKTVIVDDRDEVGIVPALTIPRALLVEPGTTLAEILSRQPGVNTSRWGHEGALSQVRIRGTNPNHAAVFLDGVPLEQADGSPLDLSTLPLWSTRTVRIWRGLAPIGYGAPIGGVLGIESRLPRSGELGVAIQGASFGTYRLQLMGGWADNDERYAVGASVDLFTTEGTFEWLDDNGTLFDSSDDVRTTRTNGDMQRLSSLFVAQVPLGNPCRLRLLNHFVVSESGLAGPASRQSTEARYRRGFNTASLRLRCHRKKRWKFDGVMALRYLETTGSDPLGELYMVPTESERQSISPLLAVRMHYRVANWLRLSGALDGRYAHFSVTDHVSAVPAKTYERLRGGVALEAGMLIPKVGLEWVPRLRLDTVADNGHATLVEPTWQLGMVYRGLEDKGFRAHLGSGYRFRPANLYELYGDGAFILASPELRPEQAHQITGGVTYAPHWLPSGAMAWLSVTGFASWVSDLIQFKRNSLQQAVAENDERALIAGAEASLRLDLFSHLRLAYSVTFLHTRSLSMDAVRSGKPLPFRPAARHHARLEGYVRDSANSELRLFVDLDHQSSHTVDPAALVRLPARTIVSLGFGWRLHTRGLLGALGHVDLGIILRNVGDVQAVDLIGYPLPGRTLTARIGWRH